MESKLLAMAHADATGTPWGENIRRLSLAPDPSSIGRVVAEIRGEDYLRSNDTHDVLLT